MDAFVRAALIGVGRDAAAGTLTNTPVDQLAGAGDERGFLLRAGARDVYLRAGLRPPRVANAADAAPPETLRHCSPRLAELLSDAVQEGDADVLRGVLAELGEAGFHLPYALLPDVLAAGDRRLRKAAAAVLGERGRWLARRNAAWSWALAATASTDAAAQWEEGSEEQQVEALHAMRAADAAGARAKLAERLPKERAEHRAALVGALEAGLSPDDEELLERALDDRSAAVRSVAAGLLSRLPQSAFSQRMQARAEAAVRPAPREGSSLLKAIGLAKSGPELLAEPPAELDPAAARDIIIPKSQQAGIRTLALTQIVAAVPLHTWTTRFAMTPEQFLTSANENVWATALIEGWAHAAIRQRDAAWARALVRVTTWQRVELARVLAADDLLALVQSIEPTDDTWPLALLLEAIPKPWPRPFALEWLRRMRQAAADHEPRRSYALAAMADIVARALPADAFEAAMGEWTLTDESWQRGEWQRRLHKMQQLIRIRRTIFEERER